MTSAVTDGDIRANEGNDDIRANESDNVAIAAVNIPDKDTIVSTDPSPALNDVVDDKRVTT